MEDCIVVWAEGRDGPLTRDILSDAGLKTTLARSPNDVLEAVRQNAAAIIAAGELLSIEVVDDLAEALSHQPPWSDIPILVVAGGGSQGADETVLQLGNASVLARPLTLPQLLSTVRAAVRGRKRQFQLRDLLAERDDAARRKDEFLAMLAHELRNPLAPIQSAAEVLSIRAATPESANLLKIVSRQVDHLARIVDDLLDVSRITRGKITLKKRLVNVGDALTQIAAGFRPIAEKKGRRFVLETPDEPLTIDADPTRLDQMVGNALANALKFTPPDGAITLSVRRDVECAAISIKDDGIGLAREALEEVFELFAQSDRTVERGQGGLGIGLTVLRGLAELHGGSASLLSEGKGRGAELLLRLPLATGASDEPREKRDRPHAAPLRILVVDDNVDAAETLAMVLRVHGHEVATAENGRDGLDRARRAPPDVVICDIGMPEMDGYEFASRLRNEPACASTFAVALTGYGESEDQRRAIESGFQRFLKKPVPLPELYEILADRAGSKNGRPKGDHHC
jgi:signal transduction histidine kinase/ActR/RegA family two-component response regulator